jgi:hypothetical protein
MISLGSEVFIKACPHGTPGVVVRLERNRVVVWWSDLDYLSRHNEESLTEVGTPETCTGIALVQ